MPSWKRKGKSGSKKEGEPSTAQTLLSVVNNASNLSLPTLSTLPSLPISRPQTPNQPERQQQQQQNSPEQIPSPEDLRRKAKRDAAFGPLESPSHLCVSRHPGGHLADAVVDEPPYFYLFTTYISFLILIFVGHIRDYIAKWFTPHKYRHLMARNGYAPLYSDFDSFYTRRLKLRINDCFDRPTTGVPGRYITLLDRETDDNLHFRLKGTTTDTLNLSSYNYLGFAQSEGPCADFAEETVRRDGISMTGTIGDAATTSLHVEVERQIARFVGKEDAVVFSMGFVTNATTFPAIVGKGCLILSDELNHASIRFGARMSGASIQVFAHNSMTDLEKKLRDAISQGQPRTHRPWKKIVVTVEGLYSMEGTMVNLPRIMELKKRYRFYLFVDEAHSIGAVGPRGRGVCDYFKIDPAEVDILMGTFTKSFGANGGYIAADKAIIDKIRCTNAGQIYGEAPTPPVLAQILSSVRLIADEDPLHSGEGQERLQRLVFNSRYLRLGLKRLGFIVYGHDDSPIIPVMLYNPAKMPAFSHEMLKRKISVVVVTYPATPLELSRARLCISASHTKQDLDRFLVACDEVGEALQIKFSSGVAGGLRERPVPGDAKNAQILEKPRWTVKEVIERGVKDVQGTLY
ncbi:serine palmitoyltransferase [Talaromyces proteolyticus]|uniref:Serine palmitoyltransferase n=1 Tax=Talaromyces proteolyticus TaxID=1131652 RepID=A0AAD4KH63_9EURO|nr:serine palmitoyltransferase [Talaromyces proteolyticus]KAH8692253.1 serine palmitoyltransferase [Talaromyces proteolyticus]